ncbi:VanW family protein [Calidifontibacillus oryziterrae]|uniref:VanW family protein n=1 Tax=Calidifontibacillus oryziterrae TaxID=1191699 RepID=UPI00030F4AA6|nr:VanW family protein [Calidifontibacillus oryziterrae]
MSRWLDLKILLLLIACTAFVIGSSSLGAFAYETVFKESTGYSEGTKVGPVSLQGIESQEAMSKVLEAIDEWKANSSFTLKYQEDVVQLDPSFLQFDIKGSVEAVVNGQASPLLAAVNIDSLKEQVTTYNEVIAKSIDYEKLADTIKGNVVNLKQGSFEFYMSEFLLSINQGGVEILSESVITGFDQEMEAIIEEWVNSVNPIPLKSMESYSLLSTIKSDLISEQRLQGLNVIATGLYEAVLKAGLNVEERHIHSVLPTYSKLGFDAKVKPSTMDLAFTNMSISDVAIGLQLADSSLKVTVEGYAHENKFEVVLKNEQTLPQKQIIQPSPAIQRNTSNLIDEGKEGKIVQVYRNKLNESGAVIESEFISEDYYPPVHAVLQVPLKPDSETIANLKAELDALAEIAESVSGNTAVDEQNENE